MKTSVRASSVSSLCKLFALSLLAASPFALHAEPLAASQEEAALVYEADSLQGGECLMVFATVGEPFRFELAGADCATGVDAGGSRSQLPRGMHFEKSDHAIQGVPMEAGFHEFVTLVTEKGVTRERVILIDIEASPKARSLDSFASYFLGGVR